MKAQEFITEIHRLSGARFDYEFDKIPNNAKWQPLPGGSGLKWTVAPGKHTYCIWIAEPTAGKEFVPPKKQQYEFADEYAKRVKQLQQKWDRGLNVVGQLELKPNNQYPFLKNAYQVHIIYVDPKARGQGVAKSLYGLALYTLGLTLIAGDSQTPGGRKNWASLSQIPGVEVKGIVPIDDWYLGAHQLNQRGLARTPAELRRSAKHADKIIDTIMQLGGQYLGVSRYDEHCFAFDVEPGNGELAPVVKTELTKIYVNNARTTTDLFARWVG